MTEPKHGQFDPDDSDADADDYERMRDLLHAHISDFAEEHDLPVGALSPLLLDIAVTTRMTDYALAMEKPSASGLKLDLDRMTRDVQDFVRDCKRHADEFIAQTKNAIREAEAEMEAADQKPAGKP